MAYFPKSNTGFAGAYTPMSTSSAGGGRVDTQARIAESKAMIGAMQAPKPAAPTTRPGFFDKPTRSSGPAASAVGGGKPKAPPPAAAVPKFENTPQPPAATAGPTYNYTTNQASYQPVPFPSPQLPTPELPPPAATPTAAAPSPAIQALKASEEIQASPEGWEALATPSIIRPGLGDRVPPQFNPALRAVAY
jgi:hypothetical protein